MSKNLRFPDVIENGDDIEVNTTPLIQLRREGENENDGESSSVHELPQAEREKYIARIVYGRMLIEGMIRDPQEVIRRIKLEMQESGWRDLNGQNVLNELAEINRDRRHLNNKIRSWEKQYGVTLMPGKASTKN